MYRYILNAPLKKELFYAGGVMINAGGDKNEKNRTCTDAVHGHSLMLRL